MCPAVTGARTQVKRDGERSAPAKLVLAKIHNAIGNQAAPFERRTQHTVKQVPRQRGRERDNDAGPSTQAHPES